MHQFHSRGELGDEANTHVHVTHMVLSSTGLLSSVFYYNSTLSDRDIASLAMAPFDLHLQPECRCPPSHPHVTDNFCEDLTGSSRVERVNSDSRDITHINDDDFGTWWQSISGEAPVNITLSLGGLRAALVVAMNFRSFPPRAMVLHYSTDGETFSPRQYFASDCAIFNLTNNGLLRFPTDVNCITTYSIPVKNQFSEFRILDVGNRPGVSEYLLDPNLQLFARATHIRLELLHFISSEPSEQYFAIKEIAVQGQACICNGHADTCTGSVCVCQHQTAGIHCESCLPLYNNKPWAAGTMSSANECEMCVCNDHAASCGFDLDLNSGVCINCTDNTTGIDCGTCADFYYNPPGIPINSPGGCQPCDCYEPGVQNGDTDCERGDNVDGSDSGQCSCKTFTTGRSCSECADGYFNLSATNPEGCQRCVCDVEGTLGGSEVCDKETGQCPCKMNVEGLDCSLCVSQHYGLGEGEGEVGCLSCDEECDECTGAGPQNCVVSMCT